MQHRISPSPAGTRFPVVALDDCTERKIQICYSSRFLIIGGSTATLFGYPALGPRGKRETLDCGMRVPVSISYRGPQLSEQPLRCTVRKEVLYETAQNPPLVQRSPGELSPHGLPGDSFRPVARSTDQGQ